MGKMGKEPQRIVTFLLCYRRINLANTCTEISKMGKRPKKLSLSFYVTAAKHLAQTLVVCISWYRIWQNETPSFYSYGYACTLVQTTRLQ